MTNPDSTFHTQRPRRRWWKRILLSLFVAILIPFVIYHYNAWRLNKELAEVIAELDEKEPGWRLLDIEKNRRVVPEKQNGAQVVQAACRMLPEHWHKNPIWDEIDKHSPALRLPEETVATMRAELKEAAAALAQARQMIDFPTGRFPITYGSSQKICNTTPEEQPP